MIYQEGIDYWVRYIQFPNMASESVVASHGDGTFTIYINTLFSAERQRDRLAHELRHLEKEHFYRDDLTIQQVEHAANGLAPLPSPPATDPPLLPDVFTEAPPGTIPIFNSLGAFRDYMFAMREQISGRRHSNQ